MRIATLRRRTKTGISVWHFCHDKELDRYFAVGGEKLEEVLGHRREHLHVDAKEGETPDHQHQLAPN